MYNISIRNLEKGDALISYKWRNDPEVWKFTGSRPDIEITQQVEISWIEKVIDDETSRRFAILCDGKYIGNVQLTAITLTDAEFHIFIGDKNYWGKGISKLATYQILQFAKEELNLNQITLSVKTENIAAIKTYFNCGFKTEREENGWFHMICKLSNLSPPFVSVFVMVYNHEKYLKQCLDGILFQNSNFNFNIVIGEDCSTDSSRAILLTYQKNYPGIFKLLLNEKNIGAVENQRVVFKNCTGKYIAMCEGDDYWTDPLKLQKQVDFLEANPDYVLTGSNATIINEQGEIVQKLKLSEKDQRDASQNELKKGLPRKCTLTLCYRNVIRDFPKEFFQVVNADTFLVCLLGKYGKYKFLGDIKPSMYRIHEGGLWSLKSNEIKLKAHINSFKIFAKYYKRVGEPEYASYFDRKVKRKRKALLHLYAKPFIDFVKGRNRKK